MKKTVALSLLFSAVAAPIFAEDLAELSKIVGCQNAECACNPCACQPCECKDGGFQEMACCSQENCGCDANACENGSCDMKTTK